MNTSVYKNVNINVNSCYTQIRTATQVIQQYVADDPFPYVVLPKVSVRLECQTLLSLSSNTSKMSSLLMFKIVSRDKYIFVYSNPSYMMEGYCVYIV